MEKVLRLGRVDADVAYGKAEREAFLRYYHHPHGFHRHEVRFRDDTRNCWYPWEHLAGNRVREHTRFLHAAGFMPNATHDGIYGYVTQAATRLFQEYVRTIDRPEAHRRRDPPSWPDGVVGTDTLHYRAEWERDNRVCRWAAPGEATPDYLRWMAYLPRVAQYYADKPGPELEALASAEHRGDSLLPAAWTFDADEVHLIGIRLGADRAPDGDRRAPDDLFVLLVNGRSFYFWGSTDANPAPGREGYLIETQHRYRLDWHNIGTGRRDRIYKAARPAGAGVMVIRDVHDHDALTTANRRNGFDPVPNPTFNIHWSGLGISNWSAGCQVASGKNYVNDTGDLISCVDYAARTDRERGRRRSTGGPRLTMGAYTVLSDLVLCYTPRPDLTKKPTFPYTLLGEATFDRVPGMDRTELADRVDLLREAGYY